MPFLHDFSWLSQECCFCLLSSYLNPLWCISAKFYTLAHFMGYFWPWVRFRALWWSNLSFLVSVQVSNFFWHWNSHVRYIFDNLAKMAKELQKLTECPKNWARKKAHFLKEKKNILWFGSRSQKFCILGEWKWWIMIGGSIKKIHCAKVEIFGQSSITAGWS